MKVLFLNDYSSLSGGAELMVKRMRDELVARGTDARIFASDAGLGTIQGSADYLCRGTTGPIRGLMQSANPFAYQSLRKVLADFDPDVIHVRMFLTQLSPLILPLLRDRPAIYHLAWYRAICPKGTKQLPNGSECNYQWGTACRRAGCLPLHDWTVFEGQRRLLQSWFGVFDHVIANSSALQRKFADEGIESEVIYNGVPVPAPPAQDPVPGRILFAGRLVPEKGAGLLINAFETVVAKMTDASLVIAGDGPERSKLEARVAQAGLGAHVRFAGRLEQDALRRETRDACVQVVPSMWAEPFGIAAIEAMISARAVIASDAGGLAEIVKDGQTGFLVPLGDAHSLTERLGDLLQDPSKAKSFGLAGYSRARDTFSIGACVDRFTEIYNTLSH